MTSSPKPHPGSGFSFSPSYVRQLAAPPKGMLVFMPLALFKLQDLLSVYARGSDDVQH